MARKKTAPPASWNCADSIEQLREMFVTIAQTRRIRGGQVPARRPVFVKPHGVASGRFEIKPGLPAKLRAGVFAGKRFACWVRFSSDTQPMNPDLHTTLGVAIKLFGVKGPKLLGDGDTQDFLLQNHDVFFVDTVKDFCEFTTAGVIHGDYGAYLAKHPVTRKVLDDMKRVEGSVATASYWSVLPYALGAGQYVKYKLEPETPELQVAPSDNPNYLAEELATRLRAGDVRLRFMVQLRTNPKTMPLDQATVRWSETDSVPVQVATLVLPRQDVNALGQAWYGENLSFNPWHALAEHEPQGSISAARRVVYHASANERHNVNGIPDREPDVIRPVAALPPQDSQVIVKAAIYPPIGVARVGNSQDEFFIGPEVADPLPEKPGFYRDRTGALKRQAARFRVFGMNAENNPVRELTADEATIEWTVHLANRKAAWFQFQLALDVPEAASAQISLLRNAGIADRSRLIIDGGKHHIGGRNRSGARYRFDRGRFMGTRVYLGELRTDEMGRLIVLGGRGVSASYDGTRAVTFANNDNWHDDVSDGPVNAKVTFQGAPLPCAPAWVTVGPPNYAPQQKSVRTMYDLMRDVAISAGTLQAPTRPSFTADIMPLFQRLTNLQWVNAGYAAAFGWQGPFELSRPEELALLSNPSSVYRERRHFIANQFRDYNRDSFSPVPWPWNYGDAMNIPPVPSPRQFSCLTATQLGFLQQWADGDFESDYDPRAEPPRTLDDVPPAGQPDMLTRAAMEHCLADAFHPGCEMTWVMRTPMMYMAPFRLKHAAEHWKEPGYTSIADAIQLPNGPLGPQIPGGLTRWMAIPWQTDTASCRSGYTTTYDPYLPTFWPARVPNQVLTEANYRVVMDAQRPLADRLAAFADRALWTRRLGPGNYTEQINHMVHHFGDMGLVEVRPGPAKSANFPTVMEVENIPKRVDKKKKAASVVMMTEEKSVALETASGGGVLKERAHEETVDLARTEKANRFPNGLR